MFIGHLGLALAAKKINPAPSLGTNFLAAQFVDLIWPLLLLMGVEKVKIDPGNTAFTPLDFVSYPFSHSLLAGCIWAIVFGFIYYRIRKDRKSSFLLGLLVLSHWALDYITHRADLPLDFSESVKVGLGLWNYPWATILVETIFYICGCLLYFRSTRASNKRGKIIIWTLLLIYFAIYILNIISEPPPDEKTMAYVGLAQWFFIGWAYWADANRKSL